MLKRMIKRAGVWASTAVGHHLMTERQRRWWCERVAPHLLDDSIIAHQMVERPLRSPRVDVLCDPYIYTHRAPYWCGTLYEEPVQAYLQRTLREGDTLIDVGANVGHIAIPAAALVGSHGRVIAFEPNPDMARALHRTSRRQRLHQLQVLPFALGDAAGQFTLQLDPEHPGGGTLRNVNACGHNHATHIGHDNFTRQVHCQVVVGDEVLEYIDFPGRAAIKIDVEGFELHALRGLSHTLKHRIDHAIIEVSPAWIGGRQGVETMFTLMTAAGLPPYQLLDDGRIGLPLAAAGVVDQTNVIFCRNVAS